MSFRIAEITHRTFIRHVEFHRVLPSTSDLAAELLPELLTAAPALVLAETQTCGRGRGENAWWADTGALTFTLVLNADACDVPVQNRPLLALAGGCGMRSVVSEYLPDHVVTVKWPNDVYAGDRKVCGILTEQRSCAGGTGLLIGVGLNVNNSLVTAPAEVRQLAVSVFDLTGQVLDLSECLIRMLQQFRLRFDMLETQPSAVIEELNRHNYLSGRCVEVCAGSERVVGRVVGVNHAGALVVDDGSVHRAVLAGTVRVLS